MRSPSFKHTTRAALATVSLVALVGAAGCAASGAGTSASGGKEGCPLTIGYSGALSGNNAYTGKTQLQAIELAVADHNKKSGVCQVEIKTFDDQADPGQTPALMQKAALDKHIVGMVGPNYSSTMQVGGPILNEGGMPMVTSAATDSSLAGKGWKTFYRTEANNLNEAANDAKYMVDQLHAKRAFIIDNQSTYGQGLAKAVESNLKKLGVSTTTGSINPQSQDYSATVQSVKSSGADLVYCGCYEADGGSFLKQLRTAGVNSTYYGTGSLSDPAFVTLAGASNAEGTYYSTSAKDPAHLPNAARYAAEWTKKYGGTPPAYSAETYDAADALLRAIDAGNHDRAGINKWLSKSHFDGVSGPIKFSSDGNLAEGATSIYAIKDGKATFVETAKA